MRIANFFKLLMLISGIIMVNVAVLSPGLIGASLTGGSPLAAASAATVLIMSLVVLLLGSHALLFGKSASGRLPAMRTHEQYWLALIRYRGVRALKGETELALSQLERMENKKLALLRLLGNRFNQSELTYRRFASAIAAVEELFYQHISGLLGLLVLRESAALEAGSGAEAAGYLGANEEIMHKLDRLLTELSRLGSANYRDALDMPCMKDIDALIIQTKYYKS